MVQHGPPGGGGRSGAALAWVGWWLVLLGFWLALSNAATAQDLLAGAVAAAIGATASMLVRLQRRVIARPRVRWLARLWRPVAAIPGDLVRLARAVLRPGPGELVEVPFAPGDDGPEDAARHVLATAAGSLEPATIVVDFDAERGVLIAHRLGGGNPEPLELG